jgi:rare lipoprotein A
MNINTAIAATGLIQTRAATWLTCSLVALLVCGCAGTGGPSPRAQSSGGYYMDDGPGSQPAPDHRLIADAQPRREPLLMRANRPYMVFGKSYQPMTALAPYKERGVGSWYGRKFHGKKTSSGEEYDMYAMTAAHPTLPIPSYVRVTRVRTGQQVIVRVNDRGPFLNNRLIDLSYTAAAKLDYINAGSAEVQVELILNPDSGVPPVQVLASTSAVPVSKPEPAGAVAIPMNSSSSGASSSGAPVNAQELTQERLQIESVTSDDTVKQTPAAAPANAPAAVPTTGPTTGPANPPAAVPAPSNSPANKPASSPSSEVAASPRAQNVTGSQTYLQLGAFNSREYAEAMRTKVQTQLEWLSQPIETVNEGNLFKLQAGPLGSREDANAIAERIRAATGSKPYAVVR